MFGYVGLILVIAGLLPFWWFFAVMVFKPDYFFSEEMEKKITKKDWLFLGFPFVSVPLGVFIMQLAGWLGGI